MSLFAVDGLSKFFGGVRAVDGVSFEVEEGEVFTIVGPNGAGKSTIFNLISRFYDVSAGRIFMDGKDITDIRPDEVIGHGIARTFQNIELFEHSTVLQNLLVGRHSRRGTNFLQNLLFLPSVRAEERAHRHEVEAIIDFLDLQAYRDKMIAGLPYGVRKIVEIGRALACGPRLLLLDEPASGLSVEETQDVAYWIEDMQKDMGLTVLMVEHDMSLVNQVSTRVLALADGKPIALGTPAEVQADRNVIEAYLGIEEEAA
ncbi:MAG: ABC transporter ATP-binding protein [Alphaproteobacteria bacterium]|nr:MAG: ABC transporter ATP-binding protein [Alphaproteobacteria bacterium]